MDILIEPSRESSGNSYGVVAAVEDLVEAALDEAEVLVEVALDLPTRFFEGGEGCNGVSPSSISSLARLRSLPLMEVPPVLPPPLLPLPLLLSPPV